MCKIISNSTFFTWFPQKQKTPTNIDLSTFSSVLPLPKLTHFYLKIPVVGVETGNLLIGKWQLFQKVGDQVTNTLKMCKKICWESKSTRMNIEMYSYNL
jgi:hypothetical protein